MNFVLIGGSAALLLLLVVAVFVARRRKLVDAGAKANLPGEQPQRRRSVGPAPAPSVTELAGVEAAPIAELPVEPRRRVAIGLTPIDAPEFPESELEEEALDEDSIELAPADPALEFVPEPPEPVATFPARREAEAPLEDAPAPALSDGDEPPSILAQLKTKKKSAPGALAGASEGGIQSEPTGPSEVEEHVSLVLVRQVPPRFDEPPRSWLGGLPMMPDGAEWPRSVAPERIDEGEVPLHFVAQIACADFPEDLWGGVGPRSGWLLLFLNPHDIQGDDPRLFRVLHTAELGSERQPPDDLRPVESEEMGDSEYRWCANPDAIPSTWRRWPVDLVVVPNEAHDDGYRMVVTPKNFSAQLYGGAPVATGRPGGEGAAPFSWRGALYVVDAVLRELGQPAPASRLAPAQREALDSPGYLASLVSELRAREEEGEGEERHEQLERLAAFTVDHPTGAAIAMRIESDARADAEWRGGAAERLTAIRAQIADRSLDSPLGESNWTALRNALDSDRHSRWTVEWTSRNSDFPVMIIEQQTSLLDLASAGLAAAVVELAADYQGDPDLQMLVPPAVRDALEPHWRALTDNRPHRIGGFHDGLQSEPEDGPQSEVLLFQIASDEAMHWMWGDGGAYFLFISPRNLAAGRFDQAEIRLEQP